jgi:superoxide reductase
MSGLKFVKCSKCGKIAVILKDSACDTMCCGQPMEVLEANTVDASQEKHVPVVNRDDESRLTVTVGNVEHPMTEEHYIEFIALETKNGFRIARLKPGDRPSAMFYPEEPATAVYAYCNLHGLWKTEA